MSLVPSRSSAAPLPALLTLGLVLGGLAACGGDDSEARAARTILARDLAADHGAREEWARAREDLAPLVAREDAALEDLLRAACAELASGEEEHLPAAEALIARAERLDPEDPVLLWCRYRVTAIRYELEPGIALLRRILAQRPDDFSVRLALASALDELGGPQAEQEAEQLYRQLLEVPEEQVGAWRMSVLYRMFSLLNQQGRSEESEPFRKEYEGFDARGIKSPGAVAHQPDTLGAIPVATPALFEAPPPQAPATRWGGTQLAASARGARVVFPSWERGYVDIGAERGAAAEEIFRFEPEAAIVVWGSEGVLLRDAGGALQSLPGGSQVIDLVPFDRMNHGVDKSTDSLKEKKDGDRDLDFLLVSDEGAGSALRLLENVGGSWTLHDEPLALLPRIESRGRLTPVDYDHDGDVDLLVTTAQGARLLRNDGLDGSGGFTDASAEAGLPAGDFSAQIEDLDRDQDVDFLLLPRGGGPLRWLSNERRGRFLDATDQLPAGLSGTWAVAADLDGDSWVDLALFEGSTLTLRLRTPLGGWRAEPRRLELAQAPSGPPRAVDLDLDGTCDLCWPCAAYPAAGVLAPGFASGGLAVTLGEALATPSPEPGWIQLADADGDRDLDLLRLEGERLSLHRAEGAGRGTLLAFQGHKDNARGIGTVVELRSGLRYRRLFCQGEPVLVGFGGEELDVVRSNWPNGVVQGNFDLHPGEALVLGQRPGQVGSCPFLYTWNGTTYEFISDVLGITPLGLPMAPGMLVPPDHDEYVLVKGEQLVPKDGVYELQFTEELREVTYLDRVRLEVVDHPADSEVFPNERFSFPPFPEPHLHTVQGALAPLSARGSDGKDWTAELARDDRSFAIPFEALPGPYRGLATPYTLELAFDPAAVQAAKKLRLFLNGWFYWTDASVNMAVARHPDLEFVPPLLSVPDGQGGWRDCGPIGFPAGKLKTMAVDVGELLNRDDPRIRLFSTLRLYWDSIRLAVDGDDAERRVTSLEPASARLWQRGFSRSSMLLGEHECEWFDWDQLEEQPRWNQHPGMYTRLGEVVPLLGAIDDRYVILGAGDALTLRFDAREVPPLPAGWRRDFLVFLDGWAKDRDPNTLEALFVEPLPFHGMSGYPYPAAEHYPEDEVHQRYRREWNTRPATRWIESLVPGAGLRSNTTSPMPARSARAAMPATSESRSPSTQAPATPATSG